jgi:arylsulfatase A-like enzyme
MLNIVLITVDCLRFDRVDRSGDDKESKTVAPNIQKLAQRGAWFSKARTAGCWTQAAFPALLTSTYGSMYNGCLGPLSPRRPNLAVMLRQHGYHTAAVQTSPLLGKRYAYDSGFDTFAEIFPRRQEPSWFRWKGMQRLLRQPLLHTILQPMGIDATPAPVYASAREATDRALEIVDKCPRPFFLWVHYMDAHWPYRDATAARTPDQIARSWRDRYVAYLASQAQGSHYPGRLDLQRFIDQYERAVAQADRQVGRLVTGLGDTNVETLFIITADHGEEFFDHGQFGHNAGSLYEEIAHVPLILLHPAAPGAITIGESVSLLDVAPTVLDAVGRSKDERMLGCSLLPQIRHHDESVTQGRPVICEGRCWAGAHNLALYADELKLIADSRCPDRYEMYDLAADPGERSSLSGKCPEQIAFFRRVLSQHLDMVDATRENAAQAPEVDQETVWRLRALGYLD